MQELDKVKKEHERRVSQYANGVGAETLSVAFNNNGADIYVFNTNKRDADAPTKMAVCICKGDDMLAFQASESYNSADTAFTSVNISGMPMKERQSLEGNPSEGIYPYLITPHSGEIRNQGIYERAAEIIDREVPKFGDVLKRYIPKSPTAIKQDFRNAVSVILPRDF